MKNRYIPGQHNLIDDITGLKIKSGRARELGGEQRGLLTDVKNWNEPHPQLKINARQDDQSVPNTRNRPTETFITTAISEDDL